MQNKKCIKIKNHACINVAGFYTPDKYFYIDLVDFAGVRSTVYIRKISIIKELIEYLNFLLQNDGYKKFEIYENEHILFHKKYSDYIGVCIKSIGDGSRGGVIGFMTKKQAGSLINALKNLL